MRRAARDFRLSRTGTLAAIGGTFAVGTDRT